MMSRVCLILLVSCALSSYALFGFGRTQSVAVQGRLICNGKPAADVKVKLYEKGKFFDKKMDEGKTNSNGEFRLKGWKAEITNIDPKVNVYHRCDYIGVCFRKFGITIPDKYISAGKEPKKAYDVGTINLMNKFTGETTDCVN